MRRGFAAAALLGVTFACARSRVATSAHVGMSQAGKVYAALLESIAPDRRDTILVADSSLVFAFAYEPGSAWRLAFDSLPAGLAQNLERLSSRKRSSRELEVTRPMLVPSKIEPFSWPEFYRRYPKQRKLFAFSPIAFTADSTNALFSYQYLCGSRCGAGNALWVARSSRDTLWRVRRVFPLWKS